MASIGSLKPDARNPRRHTPRNLGMIESSIQRHGFGRSVLLAKDGTIIAGNATIEAAAAAGLDDVLVIESDGTKIIAVKRTDVAPGTEEFTGLGLADNRAAELADWDGPLLGGLFDDYPDLKPDLFYDYELDRIVDRLMDFDPATEWVGMPEFHQDDLMPIKQVIVSFATAEDVQAFAELIGQSITMTGKTSIWFPAATIARHVDKAYVEASDGA